MALVKNLYKRLLITAQSFGLVAALHELTDIFRYKLFGVRKYLLFALKPSTFVLSNNKFSNLNVCIVSPESLNPYVDNSSLELTKDFLSESRLAKAVIATDSQSGSLLAYGFFSSDPIAIEGEVIFHPPPKSTYLFKFFIVPEARGRQIIRALVSEVLKIQQQARPDCFIAIIIETNFISRAAFGAMGFKRQFDFVVRKGSRDNVKCELRLGRYPGLE